MPFAEMNIAKLRYPLDDPRMAEFVDNLARVNGMAERMPGFVWRLVGDGSYDASVDLRPYPDSMVIISLSVWETVAAFETFVFKTVHERFYNRRDEWFLPMPAPQLVIWPTAAGELPTIEEGKSRLAHLAANGSSERAFGWTPDNSNRARLSPPRPRSP
jgi:heme-degrading monooxygenase HmoA